ncbi:hypothetical protein NEIG_01120 [Nematocida sp. ERTm5]|nr:hypothetical protein NEIG_01120 [Nematocida sp. ERTm5]
MADLEGVIEMDGSCGNVNDMDCLINEESIRVIPISRIDNFLFLFSKYFKKFYKNFYNIVIFNIFISYCMYITIISYQNEFNSIINMNLSGDKVYSGHFGLFYSGIFFIFTVFYILVSYFYFLYINIISVSDFISNTMYSKFLLQCSLSVISGVILSIFSNFILLKQVIVIFLFLSILQFIFSLCEVCFTPYDDEPSDPFFNTQGPLKTELYCILYYIMTFTVIMLSIRILYLVEVYIHIV